MCFPSFRSRSGSRRFRSARWTRHGCPRSRSRRWFPSFLQARSVRLPAAAPSFPLSPPSRFAQSRGCLAERRSFPLSGLPGPAPRLRGFPPALLVRRCCCPPGPSTGRPAPASPSSSPACRRSGPRCPHPFPHSRPSASSPPRR